MIYRSVAWLMLGLGLAGPAAGLGVSIDDFNSPAGGQSLTTSSPASNLYLGPGPVGGARKLVVTSVNGPGSVDACINCGGSGEFAVQNGAATSSTMQIIWDGGGGPADAVDLAGAMDVDLTDSNTADAFWVEITGIDQGNVTWDLQIYGTAGGVARLTLAKQDMGVGLHAFQFADFLPGPIDFTSVRAIALTISLGVAASDPVGSIATGSSAPSAVPAPPPLALLAPWAIGLAWRDRRGKRGSPA